MESSQDWLISQGFEVDQERGVFKKGLYEVPFSDLGYYSFDTLKKRLKEKGWVSDEPKTEDDTVPYPFGNWVIWQYGIDCHSRKNHWTDGVSMPKKFLKRK